jgi:hypothetical protein
MNYRLREREMKRPRNRETVCPMSGCAGARPTRRNFLATLAHTFASLSVLGVAMISGAAFYDTDTTESRNKNAFRCRPTVVSFYLDRPYLDMTGTALPYLPPKGACSAAAVSRLTEIAFRSTHCYV